MLLPEVDYYAIQDISQASGETKHLKVVAEYDNEREARQARAGLKVRGCEVFADVDGRTYRVICPMTRMKSGEL